MIEKNLGGRGVKSTERDIELIAACEAADKARGKGNAKDLTRQQIADRFAITRCRLQQILMKYKAGAV